LRLETADEVAAFEQDLLAEFVLARSSAGICDSTIRADVATVVELREWLQCPLWRMTPQDADGYFGRHLREAMPSTRARKAAGIAVYFEFLELRHKQDIHAATGCVVESPLDEVNRPRGGTYARLRIPPSPRDVARLFGGWQAELATARKYAPLVRNYAACRLTSLIGPRVSELSLLRMGDLRWELGRFGKVLLRGKGSNGRGKKERLVPLINGSRELLDWWVQGPRWEFDDRLNDPMAPLFPSERRNADGSSRFVTTDALRDGLAEAVAHHLPTHSGRLSPHRLRHFAASDLYRNGMDVVAIQEVLGHSWLNTTMIYVHVDKTHIEDAWANAGRRAADRFGGRSR
ncbi:MAG: tyrosine-type recombinase/integrase, partial [Candidatus Dormibacteria bacterium]